MPIVPLTQVHSSANGKYRYTDDLLKLAAGGGADHPTHGWSVCHTPINMERLCPFLDKYPDQYLDIDSWFSHRLS